MVAIPARNEADRVTACLTSVLRSVERAIEADVVDRVHVVVVAHRCEDDTATNAAQALAAGTGILVGSDVLTLSHRADVGAVRRLAIDHGLRRLGTDPERTWLFSTDADTVVGSDWVSLGIYEAECADAVATLGMTTLDHWHGSEAAHAAYQAIIEDGLIIDDDGTVSHSHVYGANMLVRADAYLSVGGFPPRGTAEDHQLAAALIEHGHPVARSRTWVVTTSGRTVGRAHHGLAALLQQLDLQLDGAATRTDLADASSRATVRLNRAGNDGGAIPLKRGWSYATGAGAREAADAALHPG